MKHALMLLGAGLAFVGCNKADDIATVPVVPTVPTEAEWACGEGDAVAPDTSRFQANSLPDYLQLIDLGVQQVACGFSAPTPFEVPAGATSATLLLFGHDGTLSFPGTLTDPDGVAVIDFDPAQILSQQDATFFGPLASLLGADNPVFPRGSSSAVLVPNNDGVALTEGTWTLETSSWRQAVSGNQLTATGLDSAVHAFVLLRTVPDTDATFDLALQFSGSGGLTAASAPTDPNVMGAIAAFEAAYGPIGIELGNVTYNDLPTGFDGTLFLDSTTCGASAESEALLSAPIAPQPGALNVFFVDGFSCNPTGAFDFGEALAGLANGLPGTPFTTGDGVMVSTAWMVQIPDLWAKVLAHEAGHYLGLFHTTELTGAHFDPLADTPEGLSDNLMYWDASQNPGVFQLSAEQGRVLRNHPLVRPVP